MDLHTESHDALDISAGAAVLTYTHSGNSKIVVCRVEATPIAGNGTYVIRASINGKRISPDSNVSVAAGITETAIQSRELMLRAGDVLVISLDGAGSDTAVDTDAILVDMTPLTQAEVYGGGSVLVDHNYGGADTYRCVTAAGSPIANVQIQAFVASDYAAGNTGAAYVVGETSSLTDGRWKNPMSLDPGDYVLVFFKRGTYGPDTASLTVT